MLTVHSQRRVVILLLLLLLKSPPMATSSRMPPMRRTLKKPRRMMVPTSKTSITTLEILLGKAVLKGPYSAIGRNDKWMGTVVDLIMAWIVAF
jgi:hypothetical protein